MKPKKRRMIPLFVLLLLIAAMALYNVYDNHRFVVVEQNVTVEELPEAFDGYRILQISDLHGAYLGERQADLISAINNLDYDCIVLTGDMNKLEESDPTASQAVFDLLNGLEDKNMVLWVDGNTGPFAIETINGSCTGNLTDIGKDLEKAGATVLLSPVEVKRGTESIWFVPELSWADLQMNYLCAAEDLFETAENY